MARGLEKDEIIATLQRSKLNCILVEGVDDKIVFDFIIKKNEEKGIDVDLYPCGGRNLYLM